MGERARVPFHNMLSPTQLQTLKYSAMVTGVLNSHFISNPLKRRIVDSLPSVEPEVKQQMLKYIDEQSSDIEDLGERPSPQSRN